MAQAPGGDGRGGARGDGAVGGDSGVCVREEGRGPDALLVGSEVQKGTALRSPLSAR